jgi:peroxiredoxin
VTVSRRAGALAVLLVLAVAGPPPAGAQVDTEEERLREEARERRIEKSMPAWQYDLYKRERDRNKLRGKTELDRLVEAAQLFSLVGNDPPPFTLLRADGKRVGLSDFTGEVVMLYFWSTASPYAAEELASTIHKLQRELHPNHFTVLAVSTKEKPEEVAAWMKGRALSPVFLLDTDGGVTDIYKVRAVPTIYLIGRDHRLVARAVGTRSWEQGSTRELLDYLIKAPIR